MPQFNLPDPGEGLVEADIVTWKVKVGDEVKVNDIVVEIETAKSLVELPIPWAGTVQEILVEEGATVEVGAPIIVIDTGDGGGTGGSGGAEAGQAGASGEQASSGGDTVGTAAPGTQAAPGEATPEEPTREANLVGYGPSAGATQRRARRSAATPSAPQAQPAVQAQAVTQAQPEPVAQPAPAPAPVAEPVAPAGPSLAKPPVRKYAKDKGVDLRSVPATREDGVITRADVDAYLVAGSAPAVGALSAGAAAGAAGATHAATAPAAAAPQTPATGSDAASAPAYTAPVFDRTGERETRTPVKGVRKMTAQAMTSSAFSAPHVTEFITVDVSATMELVTRLKSDREFRGVRVNPMLLVAKAVCLAVKRNPGMIAVWDEAAQEVVQKNYLNLGIAAATPRGLMVPNIKDADLMDLRQLADAMANLVETARAGRTQPAEMSGGCITITNVGVFGVDTGTPIINPGESAIVAFGAVRRQPWVVTAPDGSEEIVPRWITQLAVSFDHRLIDGELGSMFLADLAAILEDPGRALVWG
ncbi:2-oxo acid dehydrogenase subunit E2 [Ornithinimicrobium ciconiae]|uniref:Dihydrolipoamide acetyltransferase component of pyruvate dehydrogenase complex n=1 Tax=Ornithinimicrobium ciconiae TaxID=2594265 RepID=A0A516G710_9MICO|nr:dihydrolipoamide acetyltransferase family protein [Ornithinimicrobium ciconiae]QDO87309.1 2-oxo acid dehydrogenase subunit E2 [Ornithinimicrobium ciconiae]